jgi:hypothetical protein
MRKLRWVTSLAGTAFVGVAAAAAQAGTITFTGTQVDESGTGFGSVLNLLSVQNDDSEYGEVTLDSSGNEVDTVGNTKNTSTIRSVSEVQSGSNTDIGLIYNINQQGAAGQTYTVLHDFTLLLYSGTGAGTTLVDSITWTAPDGGLQLDIDQQGTGGAGWLFRVTGLGAFLSDPNNRFGMQITQSNSITHTNDGQENFYIASIPGDDPPAAMPLPPAALAGLLTLGGAGLIARLRRRRAIAS